MIKENQRLLNQLHILSDGVIVFLSMLLAYWVRFFLFHGVTSFPFSSYLWLAAAATVLCLCTCGVMGLYQSYRQVRFEVEAARLLLAMLLDTVILTAALFAGEWNEMSRWMLVFFCILAYFFLLCKRAVLRQTLRYYRRLGYNQKHVLVVGDSDLAKRYLESIRRDKSLGYLADGYVAACGGWAGLPYLGEYDQLESILEQRIPDEVVVAVAAEEYHRMGRLIATCEKAGCKLSMIPFYASYMPSNPQIDNVDGLPMINLRRIPLDNIGNAFLKRAMDIAGSLFLIVLTSPVMLIAAAGIKLTSPGPVIFKQERVGKNKKNFLMLKFRSMRINKQASFAWSSDVDDRRTKFGSFLRKCSIDELPQFFNVLKGDMSLVGPRPEIPYHVERFKEEIPRYMVKHQVRPGITGWAQVCGLRGDTSIKDRIEHDLFYIENWNLFFDIKILLMTVFRAVNSEKSS